MADSRTSSSTTTGSTVDTPIRIVHVASGDLWAGAEAQIETLLRALSSRPHLELGAVLLNYGELENRLRRSGISVQVIDEQTHSSMQLLQRLTRHLQATAPDILHTHREKENILGTLGNMMTGRRQMVRTIHGADEHRPRGVDLRRRSIRLANRLTARFAPTTIVAVSQEAAPALRKQYPRNRIVVIPNGIDTRGLNAAQVRPEFLPTSDGNFNVALLGRLEPVKRVDVFLETASSLLREHPEVPWRFHIFGDGALRADLETQAASLGITAKTTFHGHHPNAARYLSYLDAVVMCSDHEGLPMTLLESLAVGTPVVAHAVGGMTEVLKEHRHGIPVLEQTPAAFAAALAALAVRKHASAPEELGTRWSAESNADSYDSLYGRLTNTAT